MCSLEGGGGVGKNSHHSARDYPSSSFHITKSYSTQTTPTYTLVWCESRAPHHLSTQHEVTLVQLDINMGTLIDNILHAPSRTWTNQLPVISC